MATSEESSRPAAVDYGADTIAYDGVGGLLHGNGLYRSVLITSRPTVMRDQTVPIVPVVSCQLQSSREGLLSLKKAIDDLLLATSAPHGQAQ